MIPFAGKVWRIITHGQNAEKSVLAPEGRFHHSSQAAIYTSLTPEGCAVAIARYIGANDPAREIVTLHVEAPRILDMRGNRALSVVWQDIRTAGAPAPTWAFSDNAREAGAQGMLYSSRSRPDLSHLVLFPAADGLNLRAVSTQPWPQEQVEQLAGPMQLLALSGSLRADSTNTALLRALADAATPPLNVTLFQGLADLPQFSPDREADTPAPVLAFAASVARADGLVIACPEYIHALPGAFKNALDWLVSRPELICKPIALLHASHRGEDVLADLRRVLATVSDRFAPDIFARFPLGKLTPAEVADHMAQPINRAALQTFLARFADFIAETNRPG